MKRGCIALLAVAAGLLPACSSATNSTPTPASSISRPSTPVKIYLVSPTRGEVVHGDMVHVEVRVVGGVISTITSTHITPTVGHVHLYLDNELWYMSYTLSENLPVHPGLTYTMYAEFVAQDHLPFNPRDLTPTIYFSVAAA